jgi:release factor glutamine methyltransferase
MTATTLVRAWKDGQALLEAAGVETPSLDARLLLEEAAGITRMTLLSDPHRVLDGAPLSRFEDMLARREAREPVAHILGRKGFWKIEVEVTRAVLTPRTDTEALVLAVIQRVPDESTGRILDLGTGSGAILLALLAERPGMSGRGIDISAEAVGLARLNAERAGLAARADMAVLDYARADGRWSVVVSNPPYVQRAAIDTLEPEVRLFEPHLALDGGEDGLDAYRIIVPRLPSLLEPGGVFALEVGAGQWEDVADMARAAGLVVDAPVRDLSGIDRVVAGHR